MSSSNGAATGIVYESGPVELSFYEPVKNARELGYVDDQHGSIVIHSVQLFFDVIMTACIRVYYFCCSRPYGH